ncbi:NmrA/HSCARG family protein [Paenibacillus radicis (ex Gao et al. 2016)]|uniref:NmrA family transcriptional regulator n=1 Tax=Paenibacillus radicis (ex Gao et al. 2016) TaxID=1737354 RepID=A0A917MAU1_9BACL|nr:NmrA/HSCARG family protein [Paenibacillus radicis (ex Gao et al. 2016)]GGG88492.1 NmrA family transcriptional regulator [Paenibacillus radicis (ex Gao et al. 2016)]
MESNKTKPILVIGGTGTQGGNVARELLKHGHHVRILTRNLESSAAKAMAILGAEMIQGDMADPASLEPAMQNVSAIFSAQYADPYDPTVEPRNAANIVQAARKFGIEQIVHTSVAGSNLFPWWDKYELMVQTWENKYVIEELVRNGGFPYWTILHPCWFMENFLEPNSVYMAPELKNGVLFGSMKADTPLKLNSGEDTAQFARAAFENPVKFNRKDINIASDELSMTQIAQTLSRFLHKEVVFETLSAEETVKRGMLEGTVNFMEWLEVVPGYGFDINETREYDVPLKSFEVWVEENKHRF